MTINKRPFAEGQRVRLLTNGTYHGVHPGEIGVVKARGDTVHHGVEVLLDAGPGRRHWFFLWSELEAAGPAPKERGETPERVHAEHAAERYVARRYGCRVTRAREQHPSAYRSAYQAIRQFQKEEARRCA